MCDLLKNSALIILNDLESFYNLSQMNDFIADA